MKIHNAVISLEIVVIVLIMFFSQAQAVSTTDKKSASQPSCNSVEHSENNYQINGNDSDWMPLCIYDDGEKTFIEFDSTRLDDKELPILSAHDNGVIISRITFMKLGATRNKSGDIVKNAMYIVDGIYDTYKLNAYKGLSISIIINHVD